jgi:hypothetical protein
MIDLLESPPMNGMDFLGKKKSNEFVISLLKTRIFFYFFSIKLLEILEWPMLFHTLYDEPSTRCYTRIYPNNFEYIA